VKAIIFDLDGTLIDSAPDIHFAIGKVLEARGLEPVGLAQTRDFIGRGAGVLVERLMAARDLPAVQHPEILAELLGHYEQAIHLTHVYPGARAALHSLREGAWAMAICTNKPMRPTRAILAHLQLDHFFPVVIAGDSLPQRKPDPAPLRAALSQIGATRALFVGDSEVDCETAARARQDFALFTEGYRKSPPGALPHNFTFSDFSALPARAARWFDETNLPRQV
jgi:phosphoglycolate phosphatase